MRASARAAAAATGAARHADWRAARAKGAGWPAAAAATRAAAAVAQRAVNAATKSVRDTELAVSSSAAMQCMFSRAGDGRTRLGDAVAMQAAQEARRLNKLPCDNRIAQLAGVHQSWVATFGGKPEPSARVAAAGWQPRAVALPVVRPSSTHTHMYATPL